MNDFDNEELHSIPEKDRNAALHYISNAWEDAIANGIDADAVAHAAMYTALADLVSAYGEDAVALLAERLSARVRTGDFTVDKVLQ